MEGKLPVAFASFALSRSWMLGVSGIFFISRSEQVRIRTFSSSTRNSDFQSMV